MPCPGQSRQGLAPSSALLCPPKRNPHTPVGRAYHLGVPGAILLRGSNRRFARSDWPCLGWPRSLPRGPPRNLVGSHGLRVGELGLLLSRNFFGGLLTWFQESRRSCAPPGPPLAMARDRQRKQSEAQRRIRPLSGVPCLPGWSEDFDRREVTCSLNGPSHHGSIEESTMSALARYDDHVLAVARLPAGRRGVQGKRGAEEGLVRLTP